MIFQRGVKQNLITLVERMTRFTIAIKNDNKQTKPTILAIIKRLTRFKSHVKSITFDQGSEFSCFHWLEESLEADIYFCDPASPHQKGSIENRNGVIRTILPRNHDILALRQTTLDQLVNGINARPMRCLGFDSPASCFAKEFNNVA